MVQISLHELIANFMTDKPDNSDIWLEAGSLVFGPVSFESSSCLSDLQFEQSQHQFLCTHDTRTRRLWFLWSDVKKDDVVNDVTSAANCGCFGGCEFFGSDEYDTKLCSHHKQQPAPGSLYSAPLLTRTEWGRAEVGCEAMSSSVAGPASTQPTSRPGPKRLHTKLNVDLLQSANSDLASNRGINLLHKRFVQFYSTCVVGIP